MDVPYLSLIFIPKLMVCPDATRELPASINALRRQAPNLNVTGEGGEREVY